MKRKTLGDVDLNDPGTWVPFKKHLCQDCQASCCRLPVEVRIPDLVRMGVIDPFESDEDPKKIAKKLLRTGVIDHFNGKHGLYSLSRLANDDCLFIDSQTRRCTIYEQRPDTCRNHPRIGPRSGFCAYRRQPSGPSPKR